jgi:TatD DNase family protein
MDQRRDHQLWIDSHAHLSMFEVEETADAIDRALTAGVVGILVPATGSEDLDRTVAISAENPDRVVSALGAHPHEASSLDDELKRRISSSLAEPGVVAVGEIGLDYHYMNSPREDQLAACSWQLELAIESGLPVVLHNRDSWADLERLLAERCGRLRGVCHSFTEGPDEARRVVDLGLVVGISGMVTFKAADNIREMVSALSPSEIMVETDSPFLAPVPHRGRRNEPAHVVHTGLRIAEELRLDPSVLAEATTSNFGELFGWLPPEVVRRRSENGECRSK